ncbi:hypothetical protein [Actinoplanes sp. CA-252034]|uniref:hypothetical protein n=1 Tax=Actinoplanes sp. CA-252034 TaxID=3239906 RepID=UPI003D9943CB
MFIPRSTNHLLHAAHHNPAIRDQAEGESNAHKALKQRIATAAITAAGWKRSSRTERHTGAARPTY